MGCGRPSAKAYAVIRLGGGSFQGWTPPTESPARGCQGVSPATCCGVLSGHDELIARHCAQSLWLSLPGLPQCCLMTRFLGHTQVLLGTVWPLENRERGRNSLISPVTNAAACQELSTPFWQHPLCFISSTSVPRFRSLPNSGNKVPG